MRWEDLVRLENLCGGAPLASLVFCCKKSCPFKEKALEMLGISEEEYIEVKEMHRIEAKGTCFGNLAYCCSLNNHCEKRDEVLKELGITPAEYLQYKFRILNDLIPKDKIRMAFEEKVLHKFAFEMVNIDNMDTGYRGLVLGNPEVSLTLIVLDIKPVKPSVSVEVKEKVEKSEFISVRVTREQYQQIADIALKKSCNMSEVVREAIDLYLSLNQIKPVKLSLGVERE